MGRGRNRGARFAGAGQHTVKPMGSAPRGTLPSRPSPAGEFALGRPRPLRRMVRFGPTLQSSLGISESAGFDRTRARLIQTPPGAKRPNAAPIGRGVIRRGAVRRFVSTGRGGRRGSRRGANRFQVAAPSLRASPARATGPGVTIRPVFEMRRRIPPPSSWRSRR